MTSQIINRKLKYINGNEHTKYARRKNLYTTIPLKVSCISIQKKTKIHKTNI